jgi:predicted DNA-binding WGR domain protein
MRSNVVEFRQVDPGRHRFRKYLLSQQRTLFGQMDLVIHWGRIGQRLRMRCETFADLASLEHRCDELAELRRQHGYVAVAG